MLQTEFLEYVKKSFIPKICELRENFRIETTTIRKKSFDLSCDSSFPTVVRVMPSRRIGKTCRQEEPPILVIPHREKLTDI